MIYQTPVLPEKYIDLTGSFSSHSLYSHLDRIAEKYPY